MSIIKLNSTNFQNYVIRTRPYRNFESNLLNSTVTGDVQLFADASPRLKDLNPNFFDDPYDGQDIQELLNDIINTPWNNEIEGLDDYLNAVNNHPQGNGQLKRQEILRYEPGVKLDKNFLSKRVIKQTLFPYYQNIYPSFQWAFTNYHCLNFFYNNDINITKEAALIYLGVKEDNLEKNIYVPEEAFTISFWIKPKNLNQIDIDIPGTIMHIQSNFAISIVPSESRGPNGLINAYQLVLQMGEDANIEPSLAIQNQNLENTYITTVNSLKENTWNHINITWGGPNADDGKVLIYINNILNTEFFMQESLFDPQNNFGLFIGNYYLRNDLSDPLSEPKLFFNKNASDNEGLTSVGDLLDENPINFSFTNPLNAELHDIRIYNKKVKNINLIDLKNKGPINLDNFLFYLPVLFVPDTNQRLVLQTPFQSKLASTADPFNISLSFGVGGFEPSIENFVKDFAQNEFPRLWKIFANPIEEQVDQENLSANDILYSLNEEENQILKKRLYTILPCDNGNFFPNFKLLDQPFDNSNKLTDSFGNQRLDLINLDNLVDISNLNLGPQSIEETESESNNSILNSLEGGTPEDPSVAPGSILTVLRRTGDPSSNEIVIFDISNMFYGDRIEPGSLILKDKNIIYFDNEFNFTIKDDGKGNLYRADADGKLAFWNSIGNVLYEEGLIIIKSPFLRLFGKQNFNIEFRGDRNVYVLEVSIPLERNELNLSNNPTYKDLKPTNNFNESADRFFYITGVNLHNSNLNVIARANLAQPIIKRDNDRYVIKLRMDF
jgi:hypothetical protein